MSLVSATEIMSKTTPIALPKIEKMPAKPEKSKGAMYPLPESLVKNLLPEFNKVAVPKLVLPDIRLKKPESGEVCHAPRKEEVQCEPVDDIDIYEMREQSYREFKLDMEMDNAWR